MSSLSLDKKNWDLFSLSAYEENAKDKDNSGLSSACLSREGSVPGCHKCLVLICKVKMVRMGLGEVMMMWIRTELGGRLNII